MAKLTHEAFDLRVREAMTPPGPGRNGGGFAPGVNRLRQAAARRTPPAVPQLPRGRG